MRKVLSPKNLTLWVLAGAMAIYSAMHVRIESDLTHFMPEGGASELVGISRQLADSEATRAMVLSIGASEIGTAIRAARELGDRLRQDPEVAWVRSGFDLEQLQGLYELYFPRRHYMISEDPENEIPRLFEDAALTARAVALKEQLASPASTFFKRLAGEDPVGDFARILERFQGSQPTLSMQDGHFVSIGGEHAIVLLGTRSSAFDYTSQAILLNRIRLDLAEISEAIGEPLELDQSGTNRFVVSAQASMRRDFYLVAICAFVGVATLFSALIGSLRGFAIVMVPTLAGILVATTSGLLVFGELDGLTLAFGVALLGVAVDYSVHVLVHCGLGGGTPFETAARLRRTLALGAATTMASFAGLAITVFPAFREISFFAIVGLGASLGVTLTILPGMLRFAMPLPRRAEVVAGWLGRVTPLIGRARPGWLALPALVVALLVVAIPRLQWVDDLSKLTTLDETLLAEDERVRSRITPFDGTRFVIVVAQDEQAALERNAEVHGRLARAVEAGALDGVRSLHALLWSEELQLRNRRALLAQEGLAARVESAFVAEGFRPEALAPYRAALTETPPTPLTLEELEGSAFSGLLSPLLLRLDDRTAVITYLRGVHSPDEIELAVAGLEGVHWFDQRHFVNDIYQEFRTTTVRQLLFGSLLVGAILLARYRRTRPSLAALLPSVAVALTLIEAFALLGVGMNLLHVMSMIIVLGMGVDYGIFLVDTARAREPLGVTLLSLLVSCLTTVFVFGTLAISSHPVLRAIGVTTGAGILLAFLYSPLSLLVLARSDREPAV